MKVFEISRLAGSFKILLSTPRFSVHLRFPQEIRYCSEPIPPIQKNPEREEVKVALCDVNQCYIKTGGLQRSDCDLFITQPRVLR